MKATRKYIYSIAVFLAMLIFVQPLIHAEQLNLIYDDNGNLVSGDGFFREYNSLNQLVRVRNESESGVVLQEYIHDPIEERIVIKKLFNSTGQVIETTYYFDEDFVRVDYHNGTVIDTEYIYLDGQLVAEEPSIGSTKWVHGDNIGSATVITNSNGDAIENITYSPFGVPTSTESSTDRLYEGKEYDDITGQYDFHFRQYNPSTTLFGQPDTLIQNIYNPQTLNRYAFEQGNPYKYVDEDGHSTAMIIFVGIVSWIVIAVTITEIYEEVSGQGRGIDDQTYISDHQDYDTTLEENNNQQDQLGERTLDTVMIPAKPQKKQSMIEPAYEVDSDKKIMSPATDMDRVIMDKEKLKLGIIKPDYNVDLNTDQMIQATTESNELLKNTPSNIQKSTTSEKRNSLTDFFRSIGRASRDLARRLRRYRSKANSE